MISPTCPQFRQATKLTRRGALGLGSLGLLGLTLPQLLARRSAANEAGDRSFGRAKACILLFMWGGPAHQDTWDLKPDAPAEIRGEFKPIATNVPGIQICEHFPQLAQRDRQAGDRPVDDARQRRSHAQHALPAHRPAAAARQ